MIRLNDSLIPSLSFLLVISFIPIFALHAQDGCPTIVNPPASEGVQHIVFGQSIDFETEPVECQDFYEQDEPNWTAYHATETSKSGYQVRYTWLKDPNGGYVQGILLDFVQLHCGGSCGEDVMREVRIHDQNQIVRLLHEPATKRVVGEVVNIDAKHTMGNMGSLVDEDDFDLHCMNGSSLDYQVLGKEMIADNICRFKVAMRRECDISFSVEFNIPNNNNGFPSGTYYSDNSDVYIVRKPFVVSVSIKPYDYLADAVSENNIILWKNKIEYFPPHPRIYEPGTRNYTISEDFQEPISLPNFLYSDQYENLNNECFFYRRDEGEQIGLVLEVKCGIDWEGDGEEVHKIPERVQLQLSFNTEGDPSSITIEPSNYRTYAKLKSGDNNYYIPNKVDYKRLLVSGISYKVQDDSYNGDLSSLYELLLEDDGQINLDNNLYYANTVIENNDMEYMGKYAPLVIKYLCEKFRGSVDNSNIPKEIGYDIWNSSKFTYDTYMGMPYSSIHRTQDQYEMLRWFFEGDTERLACCYDFAYLYGILLKTMGYSLNYEFIHALIQYNDPVRGLIIRYMPIYLKIVYLHGVKDGNDEYQLINSPFPFEFDEDGEIIAEHEKLLPGYYNNYVFRRPFGNHVLLNVIDNGINKSCDITVMAIDGNENGNYDGTDTMPNLSQRDPEIMAMVSPSQYDDYIRDEYVSRSVVPHPNDEEFWPLPSSVYYEDHEIYFPPALLNWRNRP
ncbi:hypothetical protein KQI63_07685 [bacterium]|nr:hypothetical protein [bacterium]